MECRDRQTHPTYSESRSRLVNSVALPAQSTSFLSLDAITWVHNGREETGRKCCYFGTARERCFPSWLFPHVAPHRRKTSDVRSRARLSQDWRLSSSLSSILYAPCQRTRTGSRFALSRKTSKTPILQSIFPRCSMHHIFKKCTVCKNWRFASREKNPREIVLIKIVIWLPKLSKRSMLWKSDEFNDIKQLCSKRKLCSDFW